MPIVITREDGGVSIMADVPPEKLEQHLNGWKSTSAPGAGYVSHRIVDAAEIPADRTFRNAWKADLAVDLPKAKAVAHEFRRHAREAEFAPHDKTIALALPGNSAAEAEVARSGIRQKYDQMQAAIDAAADVPGLKAAIAAAIGVKADL